MFNSSIPTERKLTDNKSDNCFNTWVTFVNRILPGCSFLMYYLFHRTINWISDIWTKWDIWKRILKLFSDIHFIHSTIICYSSFNYKNCLYEGKRSKLSNIVCNMTVTCRIFKEAPSPLRSAEKQLTLKIKWFQWGLFLPC